MSVEDFTTYTLLNPDAVLTVTATQVTITAMNASSSGPDEVYKDRGVGFYSGDFTHRIGPINVSAASSNNSRFVILGVGMDIIDDFVVAEGSINAVWVNTATNPTVSLAEFSTTNSGGIPDAATTIASYQNAAVAIGTNFWCELSRSGTTATLKIYSDAYTTLKQTLSFTLTQSLNYEFVYAAAKAMFGSGATVTGTVQNLDLSPAGPPPGTGPVPHTPPPIYIFS